MIPGQSLTIRDPGLGFGSQGGTNQIYLGTAEKGPLYEVIGFTSPAQVVDTFGQGQLSEHLCITLMIAGGTVYGCRLEGTTAGTSSSVTATLVSDATGTITLSGAPYDRYQAFVEIRFTGTLGAGKFRYTLDNKRSWSEELTIPSGGTYVIPNTNITATFVPGDGTPFFEAGDLHAFTTTAPHYSATEAALGIAAVDTFLSSAPGFFFTQMFFVGRIATGSAAATMFGAFSGYLTSYQSRLVYMRGAMDAGSADTRANVKTAFSAVSSTRVSAVYGDVVMPSGKPFPGFGFPLISLLAAAAARAKGSEKGATAISEDLARVATGPLAGVTYISHDEYVNEDAMDAAKITTARTHPSLEGFYLMNMRLKSPTGSDYKYWQHGIVQDAACREIVATQQKFLSSNYDTNDDGTLEESEAKRLDSIVTERLKVVLLDPLNAEGKKGHVSAFRYRVDRTANALSSETLRSKFADRPLFYPKWIETEVGYATDLG